MAKTLEQLAKEIYDEYLADGEPVTMEEALEVAKQEMGAKEIKRYEKSSEPKEKKKREVKLDEVKVLLIREIVDAIQGNSNFYGVQIANPQKEITFKVGDDEYSINLVKHRPKKVENRG